MKQSLIKYSLIACVAALSACDYPAPEYPNPGNPEALLDLSSETVTVGMGGKKALSRLSSMIGDDRPSGAELKCSLKSANCAQAKEILESKSVPVHIGSEKSNNVVLVYERVVARDCNPHFIDNMSGSRSYNHPAFGCAVAANIVQMVTDRHQFTNPDLLDYPDAEKANQSYNGYLKSYSKRDIKNPEWLTDTSN